MKLLTVILAWSKNSLLPVLLIAFVTALGGQRGLAWGDEQTAARMHWFKALLRRTLNGKVSAGQVSAGPAPSGGPATFLLSGDASEAQTLSARALHPTLNTYVISTLSDLPRLPPGAVVYASSLRQDVHEELCRQWRAGTLSDLMTSYFLPLKSPASAGATVNVTSDQQHARDLREVAGNLGFEHDVRCVQHAHELGVIPADAVVIAQYVSPGVAEALLAAQLRGQIAGLHLSPASKKTP